MQVARSIIFKVHQCNNQVVAPQSVWFHQQPMQQWWMQCRKYGSWWWGVLLRQMVSCKVCSCLCKDHWSVMTVILIHWNQHLFVCSRECSTVAFYALADWYCMHACRLRRTTQHWLLWQTQQRLCVRSRMGDGINLPCLSALRHFSSAPRSIRCGLFNTGLSTNICRLRPLCAFGWKHSRWFCVVAARCYARCTVQYKVPDTPCIFK